MPISNPTMAHPLFEALEKYKHATEVREFAESMQPDPDQRSVRQQQLVQFAREVEEQAEYHLRIVMDNYY